MDNDQLFDTEPEPTSAGSNSAGKPRKAKAARRNGDILIASEASESSSEPSGGVPLMAAPTSAAATTAPPLPPRVSEEAAGEQANIFAGEGLRFERHFTRAGENVFETTEWDLRTAAITGEKGEVVFEQTNCEIPKAWSMLATNVVVSKYFRGKVGTPQREHSVKQLIGRVADTIWTWGKQNSYFASEQDADVFHDELRYLLLHQYMAFNSPVWFNLGVKDEKPQISACQPYDALVSTPQGLIPIGRLVQENAVGTTVYDAHGTTRIVATKANGVKPVLRLHTKSGYTLDVTADHLVWKKTSSATTAGAARGKFVEAATLRPGDQLAWHRTPLAGKSSEESTLEEAEAALAGWLQSDGFVGQYETGTNRSLTIEAMVVNADEEAWVRAALARVFPGVHAHTRPVITQNTDLDCKRIRLYGEALRPFVEKWNLLARGTAMQVPPCLFTAPYAPAAAYLRSVFQAEGYVILRNNAVLAVDMIPEEMVRGLQKLLLRFGIYARVRFKADTREDRKGCWTIRVQTLGDRKRFASQLGFIGAAKQNKLVAGLDRVGLEAAPVKMLEIEAVELLGAMNVYDIQTESGEYLSGNVRVHNCFINSVEDTMESILSLAKTEGMLFKWGSGTGTNLSVLRSSREGLKGGGTASGPVSFMRGFDAFAGAIKCLTPDAYIYTDQGMRTLGEVIDPNLAPGFHADESVVLATKDAPTRISHVYVSPPAPTFQLQLRRTGLSLRGTADHPVLTLTPSLALEWKRLPDLLPGDRVAVSRRTEMWPDAAPAFAFSPRARHAKKTLTYPATMTPELARLLGYMISEGCLDDERFRFCNADKDVFDDFLACVQTVFGTDPFANVSARVHPTTGVTTWGFEACWTNAVRFLKHVGLAAERSGAKRLPWSVRQSPRALVVEFLRAYFEGDGHVSTHVYAASASKELLGEIQLLLLNMGMVPLLRPHPVNGTMYWSLYLRGEQAWTFVKEIGFVSARKRAMAEFAGDKNTNVDVVPFVVDALRACAGRNGNFRCADGATRLLGFGFFNRKMGGGISYNRLRSTPNLVEQVRLVNPAWADTLETILEREFFWDAVQSVTPAEAAVTYDFTVPETHSFVANGIVNHNSGGKTRRAAKMNILNMDHPDIEEYIECKADAEKKAHALIEAGYSGAFNVAAGAYDSVFFQNANHSVRATDDFMRAVELGRDWTTCNVINGEPDKTYSARDLMHKIAQAAWVCGDPGMQFDTTINRWHTCPHTARINASNPCSEYMFLDDSACNLASLNLMRFRTADREFDTQAYQHAIRVTTTAMEIMVGNASYPTDKITVNSFDYRPLGLGYANLGALLMARGLPYDSNEGRAYAAALTAILCGEAYHQSARIAGRVGPFAGYERNRQPFLRVMQMHRDHVEAIQKEADAPGDLIAAARTCWDNALAVGRENGFRNAQATVLAPTGCLVAGSLVLTDRGLMRLNRLGDVGGAQWQDVRFNVLTDEGERPATKFYVNGVEHTRRLVTKSGYAIQGTLKHRIKIVDRATGQMTWKRFADIAPGEAVALSMGQLAGSPRTVNLPPLGEEYWTGDYSTRVPRTMTPELAELVGYFMGDGSLHGKGPRFCVADADADVAARVKRLVKDLFNLDAYVTPQQGYHEVAVHSVPLALWWEACGFAKHRPHSEHAGKGYVPHVPDAVLATNDPLVYGAFLRGLYEADGTVTGGIPCWTTVQRGFSEEVKTLLLALGLPTSTRKTVTGWGGGTAYVLRLRNTSYAVRFRQAVGFIGARKNDALTTSVGEQTARHDYVYLGRTVVDELVPAAHLLRSAAVQAMKRHDGAITRRTADALLAQTGDARIARALGFFFDTIAANEDGGEQETFDLSVPDNVTYIAQGFVSHNTIGFMMDCDTTGVEPDIAIVKFKSLVGGGLFKIVNQTVPEALERLGYSASERKAILDYIDANDTIEGAPGLADAHLPVFDCAFRAKNGTRTIHYMGHVKMMAATQPFLSGAISKTVNMPHDATPGDIAEAYLQAWKMGVKALAIYRDGSKKTQPLSTSSTSEQGKPAAEATPADVRPLRRKLPDERQSITHKFSVGGHEGYITIGLYPDNDPGEIFITMSKEGSVVSGLMDSFATSISLALQYGVPLRTLVEKFMHTRFEPSGFTGNPDIPMAKSIMDYLFRYMALKFLDRDERAHVGLLVDQQDEYDNEGINTLTERAKLAETPSPGAAGPVGPPSGQTRASATEREVFVTQADAPPCPECGAITSRNGACYRCNNCGTSIGCS